MRAASGRVALRLADVRLGEERLLDRRVTLDVAQCCTVLLWEIETAYRGSALLDYVWSV